MENIIIEKQNIKVNISVDHWEDAIEKSGELLVKSGCITEEYIRSTIDSVKELGPYIVLMPGLALAHSRPDESVLKSGISLITLKNPVNFESEMDPVLVVVTLAARDSEAHLGKLQVLAEIFSQEDSMEKIKNASKEQEIFELINGLA